MAKRYFTFDGVDSSTFNTYIANSNIFDSPEEIVDVIQVPGSNEVLYMSDGNFKPFTVNMECYIPSDMQTQVDALRQFLQSRGKPCKLVDSLKPNEYRIARYLSSFSLGASDRQGAAITISFNARAERYLTSGEETQEFNTDGTITNPTLFASKPLIRVYGNGTLTIGDYEITTSSIDTYVDIDCDSQQAYNGSTNLNSNITLEDFPQLVSGDNEISFTGITKVEITPRWWQI